MLKIFTFDVAAPHLRTPDFYPGISWSAEPGRRTETDEQPEQRVEILSFVLLGVEVL